MANRVLVGLPLYGSVSPRFFQRWLSFQAEMAAATGQRVPVITTDMAYVDHADTAIVKAALKDPDWDYIALVEHDNPQPSDWARVIATELDPSIHKIVGRWYFGRAQEDMRSICGYLRENGNFDRLSYEQVQAFRAQPGLYRVGAGMENVDDSALTFVIGLGSTAIHRSVFENWTGEMPWFKSISSWNAETQNVGYLGHDVNFCMQAAMQDISIWIDTRKPAGHIGQFESNDETYSATAMHMAKKGDFTGTLTEALPANIPTAMTEGELGVLAAHAKGKTVLEIGSRYGASAVAMATGGADKVYALDWHRSDPWHGGTAGGESLALFWAYMGRHGIKDKVIPLVGRSEDVLPTLRPDSFDLIFIDGDHSYEGVKRDITLALPLLRAGGEMLFHDYAREDLLPGLTGDLELGVTKAVDEILGKPEVIVDSLVLARPK